MVCNCSQAKLNVMATERDFAMAEVKQMVEQCQSIADEFEAMSKHTETLQIELRKVSILMVSCDAGESPNNRAKRNESVNWVFKPKITQTF